MMYYHVMLVVTTTTREKAVWATDLSRNKAVNVLRQYYGNRPFLVDTEVVNPEKRTEKSKVWATETSSAVFIANEKTVKPQNRIGNAAWSEYAYLQRGQDVTHDILPTVLAQSSKVFVVHGHANPPKEAVALLLTQLGLQPIILDNEAKKGRTIIEQFEQHSDVGFAVGIMTADDEGHRKGKPSENKARARQNVIFELGYLFKTPGRERVAVLYEKDVEKPSDMDGILYILLDEKGEWRGKLAKEIKAAGLVS